MLIKPDWDIFKAKFSHNPQDAFEWFCYLLFCREYDLDKGWFGYKNQSGIEKEPLELDDKVIGFQAKFYETSLLDKKRDFIKTLDTNRRDYNLTHLIIYTHKLWGQTYSIQTRKMVAPKVLIDINAYADFNNISIIWRDYSYFESEFVSLKNNDLARYFFTNDDYKGWDRFKDWSNTPTNIKSEYFTDENIKIVLPNQRTDDASNVVEGINAIRVKLNEPRTSVRLVGLSGVGKTRLAQALFDVRIGVNPLDIREVWYCDFGELPDPIPLHFISDLKQQNERFIVIVDNCGKEEHSKLTKSITNVDSQISLLTIEYDISDDLPEKTQVFKLEPNSPMIVEKVIERCYPDIANPIANTIAQLTGGNYRLALAIASTIEHVDNISVLTDHQLFKRLFYQNTQINEEHYKVAQIFSLVFSFNIKDLSDPQSELQLLSNFAEISPKTAKNAIEDLREKDIVQKRGDFRAILPHVLANHLSKQALQRLDSDDLYGLFIQMPLRLQRSLIKRLSYLHDNEEVHQFVKRILHKEGCIGKKIIDQSINNYEFQYLELLAHIEPSIILDLFEECYFKHDGFRNLDHRPFVEIAKLLKRLAYRSENFERSFELVVSIAKYDQQGMVSQSEVIEVIQSMFKLYTSESLTSLETKKIILTKLLYRKESAILISIIDFALSSKEKGFKYLNI